LLCTQTVHLGAWGSVTQAHAPWQRVVTFTNAQQTVTLLNELERHQLHLECGDQGRSGPPTAKRAVHHTKTPHHSVCCFCCRCLELSRPPQRLLHVQPMCAQRQWMTCACERERDRPRSDVWHAHDTTCAHKSTTPHGMLPNTCWCTHGDLAKSHTDGTSARELCVQQRSSMRSRK
jgi:hypothetical protein